MILDDFIFEFSRYEILGSCFSFTSSASTDVILLPGRKYTAKATSLYLLKSSPFQQQHPPHHSLASLPVQSSSAGFAIKSIRVCPLAIIIDCLIPGVDDALPQLFTSNQPTNPTVPSPVASL